MWSPIRRFHMNWTPYKRSTVLEDQFFFVPKDNLLIQIWLYIYIKVIYQWPLKLHFRYDRTQHRNGLNPDGIITDMDMTNPSFQKMVVAIGNFGEWGRLTAPIYAVASSLDYIIINNKNTLQILSLLYKDHIIHNNFYYHFLLTNISQLSNYTCTNTWKKKYPYENIRLLQHYGKKNQV